MSVRPSVRQYACPSVRHAEDAKRGGEWVGGAGGGRPFLLLLLLLLLVWHALEGPSAGCCDPVRRASPGPDVQERRTPIN